MLYKLNSIPAGLLDCDANQLFSFLKGPSLIELEGEKEEALFLSVLLHGNESTGWEVAKQILNKYKEKTLPRSLILFIGNVEAANKGLRKLEGQPDYNRIWTAGETREHVMVQSLLEDMAKRNLFASIDIHNNTGINPHYACINRLDNRFIHLARTFTRMVIYFVRPNGVQSKAFAKLCPSVTLECGQAGDEYGIQLASNFVDTVLNTDQINDKLIDENEIDLFHTIGIIKIKPEAGISFGDAAADIQFIKGIENLNFEEIPIGTPLAQLSLSAEEALLMLNEEGEDILSDYFELKGQQLLTKKPLMPAMLTNNEKIIRQDCFCYLMERYRIEMGEKEIREEESSWLN